MPTSPDAAAPGHADHASCCGWCSPPCRSGSRAVGLYPYLGVEILIWSIYALGFNLLLGTAGLPSFGHGAYFGVGAYAFGLCQFNVVANLWVCLARGACSSAALAGALVALFISHRRGIYYAFMTIAFGQIFWSIAIKSHSITGGEDGLLNIARLPADFGFALVRPHRQRRALLFRARRCSRSSSSRCGGWCIRPSAACSRRSGRTRRAPRISATTSGSTRPRSSRSRPRSRALPAACSRWRSSPPFPT